MDPSKPTSDKGTLSPINEQSEQVDENPSEAKGKTGSRSVSGSQPQNIPETHSGPVMRRKESRRGPRPTTVLNDVSPLGAGTPRSTDESPSSGRSRGLTISSAHSSETKHLWSQLSKESQSALDDMREAGLSINEFAEALTNAGEDSEGVNSNDVAIPEILPHQIVDHCDLTSDSALLTQCLSPYNITVDQLPVYERERLTRIACRHLAQIPPVELQNMPFVQQCLTSLPARSVTCFQQVLPATSEALQQKNRKTLILPCEASLTSEIERPGQNEHLKLMLLIKSALTLLHTSCYQQLLKNGYNYLALVREAEAVIMKWQTLESTLPKQPEHIMTAIKADQTSVLSSLQKYRDMLKTLQENDFRSEANFQRSVSLISETALHLLLTEESSETGHSKQESLRKVQDHITKLSQRAFEEKPGANAIAKLLGYESRVKSALGKVNLQNAYADELAQTLQRNCARPYEKKLVLSFNGELHKATVRYTPAACIRVSTGSDDPLEELASPEGFYAPYKNPYKGEFCPSVVRNEADHCVNLMSMTVTLDDEPEETACIYKEIRVGIPFPFAVEEARQKETEDIRWDEILTTALLQNQETDLQAAMNDPNHAPIKLPVMYNCLLSPDRGRPLIQRLPFADPEITWCQRTHEKIEELNSAGVRTLTIKDHNGLEYPIRVKPDVRMLINPCNEMAFHALFSKAGTWPLADEYTAELLTEWLGSLTSKQEPEGEVGRFLRRQDIDPLIRQQVREQALEIRQIFSTKAHHKLSKQPFLFNDTISELGRHLGYANVTGCKSAKDRTGEKSESDIRFAFNCYCARKWNKSAMVPTSIIPYLWMPLTEEDYFNALQCNLNSGQEENCQNNTSIPGRKVPKYMLGPAQANFAVINRKVDPDKKWLKSIPPL